MSKADLRQDRDRHRRHHEECPGQHDPGRRDYAAGDDQGEEKFWLNYGIEKKI